VIATFKYNKFIDNRRDTMKDNSKALSNNYDYKGSFGDPSTVQKLISQN